MKSITAGDTNFEIMKLDRIHWLPLYFDNLLHEVLGFGKVMSVTLQQPMQNVSLWMAQGKQPEKAEGVTLDGARENSLKKQNVSLWMARGKTA